MPGITQITTRRLSYPSNSSFEDYCKGRELQVARVWDALFCEGSKILFRTALAVLKTQEDALLAIDNAGAPPAGLQNLTGRLVEPGTTEC